MRQFCTILVLAALAFAGCRNNREFGSPQLFGPGSADYQQHRAQQFDPYPDTDIGPSVEGGRPDGYSAPAPEAVRGHTNRWSMPIFGR